MRLTVASAALLLLVSLPCTSAIASSNDVLALDAAGLAQLESRAEHAGLREQCFLYTELLQIYTEVASQQFAAGDSEKANTSLKRVEHFAELVHQGLMRDSKHLKDAEKIVHTATYHLGQLARRASDDDKALAESTLKKLNAVHEELLAQVFAH